MALKKARVTHFRYDKLDKPKIDFNNSIILPYTPTLEKLKPALKACNKNLIFKYHNKLGKKLCNNKLTNKKLEFGVYKVDCKNCPKFNIGETGRSLNTRMNEHKNDVKNNKASSGIAQHVNLTNHEFDFDNVSLITPNSNISKRHVIESSLIIKNKSNCVNLNNGFVVLDNFASNLVCNYLNLNDVRNCCSDNNHNLN